MWLHVDNLTIHLVALFCCCGFLEVTTRRRSQRILSARSCRWCRRRPMRATSPRLSWCWTATPWRTWRRMWPRSSSGWRSTRKRMHCEGATAIRAAKKRKKSDAFFFFFFSLLDAFHEITFWMASIWATISFTFCASISKRSASFCKEEKKKKKK